MELTFKVTDIEYDFDDEKDIASPDEAGVPMEMEVTIDVDDGMDDDEIGELIVDAVTDETGWCIKSLNYEEITEEATI